MAMDFSAYVAPLTGSNGAYSAIANSTSGLPAQLTTVLPLGIGLLVFGVVLRWIRRFAKSR